MTLAINTLNGPIRLQEMSTYSLHVLYSVMASGRLVGANKGIFLFGRQKKILTPIPSKNMRI
jgi:hypothetical protein